MFKTPQHAKKNTSYISNSLTELWGSKFQRCPPDVSKGPMPPFPMTNSLKSWFPASFLSKGLMLPIAHPWWHADTQKKASSKHLLTKPALRMALPSLRMTKILSFQPTTRSEKWSLSSWMICAHLPCARKQKNLRVVAWRNHSSYIIPPTKNISTSDWSSCAPEGLMLLLCCCCCFDCLLLLFFVVVAFAVAVAVFCLVITCLVTLLDYNSYHSKLRAKISRPWWYWSTNNGNSQQKHV